MLPGKGAGRKDIGFPAMIVRILSTEVASVTRILAIDADPAVGLAHSERPEI